MINLILILIIFVFILIKKSLTYENFENLKYDTKNLEKRYYNINIIKRDSNRDFNEDYTIYYNFPYKCVEYQDIINNNYLNY